MNMTFLGLRANTSFHRAVVLCCGFMALFVLVGAAPVAADEDDEVGPRVWTREICENDGGVWMPSQSPQCQFIDPARTGDASNPNFLTARYINPLIRFLAVIVGLIVVISIVVGGIQYASSADDPQKVAKAKDRIINSIIGLLAFLVLYGFLEWLVPGGIFNQ